MGSLNPLDETNIMGLTTQLTVAGTAMNRLLDELVRLRALLEVKNEALRTIADDPCCAYEMHVVPVCSAEIARAALEKE